MTFYRGNFINCKSFPLQKQIRATLKSLKFSFPILLSSCFSSFGKCEALAWCAGCWLVFFFFPIFFLCFSFLSISILSWSWLSFLILLFLILWREHFWPIFLVAFECFSLIWLPHAPGNPPGALFGWTMCSR